MEFFVEVKQGRSVPDPDDDKKTIHNTYEADGYRYHGFRLQAAGDEKKILTYPLCLFFNQIGFSGWDYLEGNARGVGFDFDDILGHAKVGLTADQLAAVLEALKKLPYVEIRRSTGGAGYHVWVWFPTDDLPKVVSRVEMKALARAVLSKMSFDTGYHFEGGVDHLGDILWVCSRRATEESRGLTLIKDAERPMTEWPKDFKDQIPVVTRKRQKTVINGTTVAESDDIDRSNRNRKRVPLEDAHRKFIEQYGESGFYGYWCEDHGCFVAHTCGLAKVSSKLKVADGFETVSEGGNPEEPNCWCYPLPNGGWRVYRFGKGTPEATIWETSKMGWTTCVICLRPGFLKVAKIFGGILSGKGFVFNNPANVQKVLKVYQAELKYPAWFTGAELRPVAMRPARGGLAISMAKRKTDAAQPAYDAGWTIVGNTWITFAECEISSEQPFDYEDLADNMVRHVARNAIQEGLYVHTTLGWQKQATRQIDTHLTHQGHAGPAQQDLLGWSSNNPWIRTALPFSPQEPGERLWNLDGCQLAYQPSPESGPTPYWDRLFTHWGRGLDDAVESHNWCAAHGIKGGADYLRWWFATMIRHPERHLPLLATFSPENNTGKSLMHEAPAKFLTPNGYMLSEKAIKNKSGFDAELHGRVLCALDDIDLSADNGFYDALKRWITNDWMNFGYKGKEVFMDRNFTHWIAAVQTDQYIPLSDGDERIVLWEMTPFPTADFIAKPKLLALLEKEHSFLLHKLFALDLSEIHSRLALPSLVTVEKAVAMARAEQHGLSGTAEKLAAAITLMERPWTGTAVELCKALGNWDGRQKDNSEKELKSRANSMGRYMQRVANHLGSLEVGRIAIEIDKINKGSVYTIT